MRAGSFALGIVAVSLLLFATGATASEALVTVTVERIGGEAVPDAYVALIPIWRVWSEPLAERIAERGSAQFRLPPGSYYLLAGARGLQTSSQGPLLISLSKPNRLTATLRPVKQVSGTVRDETGRPLAGVRVAESRAAVPAPFDMFSTMAARYFAADWETRTDEKGNWSLGLPDPGTVPLLFEAPGRSAQWRHYRQNDSAALDVKLPPGIELRLTLDRADPNVAVTLERAPDELTGTIPPDWQRQVWAKWTGDGAVVWPSLPPGVYSVYASYPDQRFFSGPPAMLTTVALSSSGSDPATEIHATLPSLKRRAGSVVSLFLPDVRMKDLSGGCEGVARDAAGRVLKVETAVEEVIGGSLLFFNVLDAQPPFVASTADRFIAAIHEEEISGEPAVVPSVGALHPRADASLTLRSAEDELPPPAIGLAVFRDCQKVKRITVPMEVRKGNLARLTGPGDCRGAVLSFDPFEPVVVGQSLRPGEQFLGDHLLHAAGSADIRVVRDPGGEAVAGATAQVFVSSGERPKVPELLVAEAVAGQDGWAHLSGLPVRRILVIAAQSPTDEPSDSMEVNLDPRARRVIDPLLIPRPATLLVTAKVAASVAARFPAATVRAVFIQPADRERALTENREQDIVDDSQPVRFDSLRPGRWKLAALVKLAGTDGLLDFDEVELKAGETRSVDGTIEPLIFEGRVTSGARGVATRIEMADPFAAGIVQPHITSRSDGSFHVLLPHRGNYDLTAVLLAAQSDQIPLGGVDFADPALPMDIVLPSTGTLIVHVHDGRRPVARVLVSLDLEETGGHGRIAKGRDTDSQGTARFERLVAGGWLLSLKDEATGRAASLQVLIAVGQEQEVEVQMPTTDSIGPDPGGP